MKPHPSTVYITTLAELGQLVKVRPEALASIPKLLTDKPCDTCGVLYQFHKDLDHYFRYEIEQ
jgi:hypothetical protein